MNSRIYTVAILGVGSRGGNGYGRIINTMSEQFKIVSLCDIRRERLDMFAPEFNVPAENCFDTDEEFLRERRADLLIIATQDKDHVRHCLRAFELGYDVLMEKPITADKDECLMLLEAQKKYGNRALVCHVLRYSKPYMKVMELIDEGKIGRLVAIDALEPVKYWHQAHSYVRGNWRRTGESTPMILAKCCHDLDLLQYYAKSRCESVSSVGDLTFFNQDNAPEGCATRCTECKYADTCEYSAKDIYVNGWHRKNTPEDDWPFNIIASAPITEEKLWEAIKNGPYGRCVFHCDNDAVDHQMVQMTFKNGVKASLLMTAFNDKMGRCYRFYGTHGMIILANECVTLREFGKDDVEFSSKELLESGHAHGGGDFGLISSLYAMLTGAAPESTSLEASVESHLMGIAAEESRLHGGALIKIH
ncbi:MAG: Gfo/Idh/MocA family oxidoreductase [Clostridia bacterium]|nr:Gfo/Idh/MocA family oxidoreductase [Clostridia bacterium]